MALAWNVATRLHKRIYTICSFGFGTECISSCFCHGKWKIYGHNVTTQMLQTTPSPFCSQNCSASMSLCEWADVCVSVTVIWLFLRSTMLICCVVVFYFFQFVFHFHVPLIPSHSFTVPTSLHLSLSVPCRCVRRLMYCVTLSASRLQFIHHMCRTQKEKYCWHHICQFHDWLTFSQLTDEWAGHRYLFRSVSVSAAS